MSEQDGLRHVGAGAEAPVDPDLDGAGQGAADGRRDLVQAVADFVEDLVDGDGECGEHGDRPGPRRCSSCRDIS